MTGEVKQNHSNDGNLCSKEDTAEMMDGCKSCTLYGSWGCHTLWSITIIPPRVVQCTTISNKPENILMLVNI